MSDEEEIEAVVAKEKKVKVLQQQLARVREINKQSNEENKRLLAQREQLINTQLKSIKDIVSTQGVIPATILPLETLHLVRESAPDIFENSIDWSGASKVQESFINNTEHPIYISFIDEDGEVLELETTMNEGTSNVFDRYACKQRTPFLLSRIMYEFRYNGKVVPFVKIGSIVFASDGNAIIYVTTRLPSKSDFDSRIIPNIPAFVQNHPRCFIDNILVSWGDQPIVIKYYLNGDTGTFVLEYTSSSEALELDAYEFIRILQKCYSELNGFYQDINVYFGQLVSKYESQVEQLNTDQRLDKPNAIILRMIKIRQQLYRLLSLISSVTDMKLDSYSDRLRGLLPILSDEMKMHASNTSLHKVKKPLLESEDVVRVKRWPNNDKTLEPSWEKGTITSYTEHEDIDGYGPRRVYSVEFDNGECRSDIEDYQVIPGKEYKYKDSHTGDGIKKIVDEDSSDPWAREVGWYNVDIKGTEETFVHMSDALRVIMSGATMFFNRPQHLSIREDYQQSVLYLRIDVLQLMDRISDPIMRRIGDILLQPAEKKHALLYEVEQEGLIWRAALELYNDKQTNQMRDGIYKLALSKQCKIFAFDGSVNIDQVCRFFISSKGCLETFLLKVPIFREGYDSTIHLESDHEKDFYLRYDRVFAYLTNNRPDDADDFMSIKFVDGRKSKRYTVACDAPLKELLTKYAEDRGTSIKSLRIKHNERTLFLSSIGKKTPEELSIEGGDTFQITIIQSTTIETSTKEELKQRNTKKGKNNKNKKHKKSKKKQPVQIAPPEDHKGEHSKLLSKIHEEAESQFKEIRQRLNAMNLERTKPKQRTSPTKATKPVEVVDNPHDDDQLEGKAGKTQFIIQVGEVSNLYKTTKPSSAGRGRRQDDIMIDLHGLTAEGAVYRLDKHLPTWIETAMKGIYPFVIPVKIVCGGGSQILAEVVENWIKQNDNVANAPKNMYN